MKSVFSLFFGSALLLFPTLVLANTVNYQYDDLGRLTSAEYENGSGTGYTYDAVGNRQQIVLIAALAAIYEDAEDGNTLGWAVYDNTPEGATIANVLDTDRNSRVIEFTGDGTDNGYRLLNPDGSVWNDNNTIIQWAMNYSERYTIYVSVQTTQGHRYIYYTASDHNNLGAGNYIHHGLGADSRDGNWHTFTRDLAFDLKQAQPENELTEVLGFLVRGSGRIDDIQTLASLPVDLDSDNDGLSDLDEINIYGTNPYAADSDGDGMTDGDEVAYWGNDWNSDPDNDGIINLLDNDSDNDGINDGEELEQGTDPADGNSISDVIIYEDAENSDIAGWTIFDNDPAGAVIANVTDLERDSRVIEFSGAGRENGYRLRSSDGSMWNNSAHTVIDWSMKFAETYTVYVHVQTSQGQKFIYYTASDHDNLGTGNYIHHGLGQESKDSSWHTFTRDLEYDLKDAQPDNELVAILGLYVRGSGRIDDIKTLSELPPSLDSDNDGIFDVDEINTYGTNPYAADSDGDGMADGDEVAYWADDWNNDADNDGIINLLDDDSDNDGINDGDEVAQGTDPGDPTSVSSVIVYSDAEGQDSSTWTIYDNDPAGARIHIATSEDWSSTFTNFSGSGTGNGYQLRRSDGSWWNNSAHQLIEWSMQYSESYVMYVAVQTTEGFRYIYYTSSNNDNLGDGTYIHHGLGSSSRDGSWHTFTRNLEDDLHDAQPGNDLIAILGFLVRGSGNVDDIQTMYFELPQ